MTSAGEVATSPSACQGVKVTSHLRCPRMAFPQSSAAVGNVVVCLHVVFCEVRADACCPLANRRLHAAGVKALCVFMAVFTLIIQHMQIFVLCSCHLPARDIWLKKCAGFKAAETKGRVQTHTHTHAQPLMILVLFTDHLFSNSQMGMTNTFTIRL